MAVLKSQVDREGKCGERKCPSKRRQNGFGWAWKEVGWVVHSLGINYVFKGKVTSSSERLYMNGSAEYEVLGHFRTEYKKHK